MQIISMFRGVVTPEHAAFFTQPTVGVLWSQQVSDLLCSCVKQLQSADVIKSNVFYQALLTVIYLYGKTTLLSYSYVSTSLPCIKLLVSSIHKNHTLSDV